MAALALALLAGGAWAQRTQYLDDGAIPNPLGGWELPEQGTCPADSSLTTRPDCGALRLNIASASCIAPNYAWTTSGVCNDTETNELDCEAQPGRLWNGGTSTCAVTMKDHDRNNVTCAVLGGVWSTAGTCTGNWLMPAVTAYEPDLLTTNGAGDQCFRCHNAVTQYNGPRLRDVDGILDQGHKNIVKKVVANQPQYPPHGTTPYPTDESGNPIDWTDGQISVGGTDYDLAWLVNNWMAPLGRSFYKGPPAIAKVCRFDSFGDQSICEANGGTWIGGVCEKPALTVSTCAPGGGLWADGPAGTCSDPSKANFAACVAPAEWIQNAGLSYSCARCHTTGWTQDATLQAAKQPEASFAGITWLREADAASGVINLSGGVSGSTAKTASWDQWGISCSRCHMSAVNNTGGAGPFNAPAAMSTHHNNLTPPNYPAACTVSGKRSEADCLAAAGTWNYGYCTDPRFAIGTNPATAKTACETGSGMGELAPGYGAGVWVTPCSNNNYGNQTACELNSGTWTAPAASACSVAGICSTLDPAHNSKSACEAVSGAWWAAASDIIRCENIHEYGKEHGIPAFAAAAWTGNFTQRGQIITALCLSCHRSDSGGIPREPSGGLIVGNSHGELGMVGHGIGQAFLNSPHAKFTGNFNQVASGKFKYDGTGEYKSFFMAHGEAANTGNGCTGCHDVHKSILHEANPAGGAIKEECTECHAKTQPAIMHPTGGGTPFAHGTTGEGLNEACASCHMPVPLMHVWRINVDPAYSTFPAGAVNSNAPANTAPDGTYTNAVWNDVDLACGKCHGGGTQQATSIIASSAKEVITVASGTGFYQAAKVRIAGAGGLEADGVTRDDYVGTIKSVAGNVITLLAAPNGTVAGKTLEQNFTTPEAGYMNKSQLAVLAAGMHNDAPVARFFNTQVAGTLQVNFSAQNSTCSGALANCDAFVWDFGDGSTGSGATTSHTYATGGPKTVTLTVQEYGVGEASKSKIITVAEPDPRPTLGGVCTFDANSWIATCTDASTDPQGIKRVTINWGDGTMVSTDTTAPYGPFTHKFLVPGTFTVTKYVYDTVGQQSKATWTMSPALFSIGGTVFASNGTTPLGMAKVEVKKAGVLVKTVYTAANGTYSAGALKPATYTLSVTKLPHTFAEPAATVTVGPSSAANNINATTP